MIWLAGVDRHITPLIFMYYGVLYITICVAVCSCYTEAAKEGSFSTTEISEQYTISYEEDMSWSGHVLEEIRERRETATEERTERSTGAEKTGPQSTRGLSTTMSIYQSKDIT